MDTPIKDSTPAAKGMARADRRVAGRAAALVLLVCLAVTGLLFAEVGKFERDKAELIFHERVNRRIAALSGGIDDSIDVLRSVDHLFASTAQVTRAQFRMFTQPLMRRYPYTQAINFQRLIENSERPAFERALQQIVPGAVVTEMQDGKQVAAGVRPRYRVIEYIEPANGNQAVLGLDTAYPEFNEATRMRAYTTGLPTAGKMVRLAQGPEPRVGVVISMPVYRYGAPLTDAAARLRALAGEAAIVIRPGELVSKVLASTGLLSELDFEVQVYAVPSQDPVALVFHIGQLNGASPRVLRWLYPAHPQHMTGAINVAGSAWLVVASGSGQPVVGDHLASLFSLALGLVVSLLGAAYVYELVSRNREIQHQVEQRTSELDKANQALLLRQRAIESSPDPIIIASVGQIHPVVYVNPAFERTTGYSLADVLGKSLRLLFLDDDEQQGLHELRTVLSEQREGHVLVRNYRKDGSMFWNEIHVSPVRDESGKVTHYVSIQHDVTKMKEAEAELRRSSTHDALTGLPNRVLLQDRLRQAVAHAAREGNAIWVVSIDLDRFKFMNGRLGRKGGDRLLQAVAERLAADVRPVDTVVRSGGDEFALVLLPEHGRNSPRVDDIQRLLKNISAPISIDGTELFLSCSIGVSVFPADGADPDQLLERADIAMYRAKELGRDNFQFYTAAMNDQLGERLMIEGALRSALERDEFVLHYQPQVDISTGRIVGMEALIRWQHPELGMVEPKRFIALAEETGLIIPIGAWVLRSACKQLLLWQTEGRMHLRMAVNVSVRQMAEQDFVQSVADVLAETGLTPGCLELELTESVVMNDVERAIEVMHALKRLGVKLAIDDFGTGYSSLAHLKRFEIDVLKIDQSFVRDLTIDPDDAAIVVTIIALAANLNLQVISEGVETFEQLAFLRENGCDEMQGFYVSRPVSADAFERVLREYEAKEEA